jgi:hypothetical protein
MYERSERIERHFEPLVIVATLLVVPVLLLQRAAVDEPWRTVANVGDSVTWLVFLAEVAIMLAVVPSRRRWLARHPLDVAIVVFTPPFLTAALTSMRLLRRHRRSPGTARGSALGTGSLRAAHRRVQRPFTLALRAGLRAE